MGAHTRTKVTGSSAFVGYGCFEQSTENTWNLPILGKFDHVTLIAFWKDVAASCSRCLLPRCAILDNLLYSYELLYMHVHTTHGVWCSTTATAQERQCSITTWRESLRWAIFSYKMNSCSSYMRMNDQHTRWTAVHFVRECINSMNELQLFIHAVHAGMNSMWCTKFLNHTSALLTKLTSVFGIAVIVM